MSPVSKSRKKKNSRPRPARRPEQVSPYAEVIAQQGELARSPASWDPEGLAAALVGAVWIEAWGTVYESAASDDLTGLPDPDQTFLDLFDELVEFVSGAKSPAALATLRALALVGEEETREPAATAADELAETGVAEPAWLAHAEETTLVSTWRMADVFDEVAMIALTFRRDGEDQIIFAVTAGVDLVRLDVLPGEGSDPREMFAELSGDAPGGILWGEVRAITPEEARSRLLPIVGELIDAGPDPEAVMAVGEALEDEDGDMAGSPLAIWPLLYARLDGLYTGAEDGDADADVELKIDGSDIMESFLASPMSASLRDREAAQIFAAIATDFAIEAGWEPDRFGPIQAGELGSEIIDHVILTGEQLAALPALALAWGRFAAHEADLPAAAREVLEAELTAAFGPDFAAAYAEGAEHREECSDAVPFAEYMDDPGY